MPDAGTGTEPTAAATPSGAAASAMVPQFLAAAVGGDSRRGRRLALDLLDAGACLDEVVVDLLACAQRRVGENWMHDRWSVVDEHRASAVTQVTLDCVASAGEVSTERARVVVACAEGDWHSLPSQMFAEQLRSRGFAVDFLGASCPAAQVGSYLRRRSADALVVSCSMAIFFGGVVRCADAAHANGVRVMAGGGALGDDPSRAMALGADAWARDVNAATAVLDDWNGLPPLVDVPPTRVDTEAVELSALARQISAEAYDELAAAWSPMADYTPEQRARTLEDLCYITQFAAAARLARDRSVFTDFVYWLDTVLSARHVPLQGLTAGLGVLIPIVGRTSAEAARLLCASLPAVT